MSELEQRNRPNEKEGVQVKKRIFPNLVQIFLGFHAPRGATPRGRLLLHKIAKLDRHGDKSGENGPGLIALARENGPAFCFHFSPQKIKQRA
jgi:hypothetical protein